jgi:membrane fusion protein (multidrug efflux system)
MTSDETPNSGPRRRRLLLGALALLFAAAGIGWASHYLIVGRYHVETDDAYVQSNVVQITPQVAGTVLGVMADDTQFVHAGDPLVKLDPADAEVAIEQAKAQLAQAVREVRVTFANNGALAAAVKAREADIERERANLQRAEAELARAQADATRRRSLEKIGGVSGEEIQHAQTAIANARAAVAAAQAAGTAAAAAVVGAREQLNTNLALTDNTTVESHPNVLRAAARVREAMLALDRVQIDAPVSGYVARRSVQIGQRVAPGAPLMAVVPLDQVWVDANFKENQLPDMRIDQPVVVSADVYGEKVDFRGRVAGLGAGTGAAFSILPAQNATGNWIKIVQRVPVRIALDPEQVRQHPLRIGLSMSVRVDTHDRSGSVLAQQNAAPAANASPAPATAARSGEAGARSGDPASRTNPEPTAAVSSKARSVQTIIDEIIEANLPRTPTDTAAAQPKAAVDRGNAARGTLPVRREAAVAGLQPLLTPALGGR